jgi:hypothetical protein
MPISREQPLTVRTGFGPTPLVGCSGLFDGVGQHWIIVKIAI